MVINIHERVVYVDVCTYVDIFVSIIIYSSYLIDLKASVGDFPARIELTTQNVLISNISMINIVLQ